MGKAKIYTIISTDVVLDAFFKVTTVCKLCSFTEKSGGALFREKGQCKSSILNKYSD